MKKKMLLVAVALVALHGLVFAQAKTSLNIQCNQSGARIYLNDNLAGYTSPNFSSLVVPGMYRIRVAKDGFPEFKTTVVVGSSPITIMANLGGSMPPVPQPVPPSAKYQLSIESNIRGAQVYLDGAYAGITPFVSFVRSGTYTISIRLDGYEDYTKTIRVNGSYRLYASLKAMSIPVYIDAVNAPGASVYRDSSFMGTVPYRSVWMPGSYFIRITAPGYADYVERVSATGPLTMQVSLAPLLVDYEIRIPELFATLEGNIVRYNDVEIYLDGRRLESPIGKALPGTHRLILFLGDLRFEAEFELVPGRLASIEPYFGISVR